MIPFLPTDLTSVLRGLMRKFIKHCVMEEADTEELLRVNVEDKANHLTYSKIDIGFKAEDKLKEAKVSERQTMEFRLQCKDFLLHTVKKMKEKSPLVYSLVRNMASLNPNVMAKDRTLARERFKKVLRSTITTKTLNEADAEDVLQQYNEFLDNINVIGSEMFTGFNQYSDRVDDFFMQHMAAPRFDKLLTSAKLFLILSHGQATVERRFSVNKEVECENMKAKTVVAQRLVYDHVKQVDGVLNVHISNKLIMSCANARLKYEAYLEEQRQQKKSESEKRKRKCTLEEIVKVKKRKKRAEKDHDSLLKSADELCIKAGNTGKLELLSQSNASRKRAKEKLALIKELEKKLETKLLQLKAA